jgi:hypothetical protein
MVDSTTELARGAIAVVITALMLAIAIIVVSLISSGARLNIWSLFEQTTHEIDSLVWDYHDTSMSGAELLELMETLIHAEKGLIVYLNDWTDIRVFGPITFAGFANIDVNTRQAIGGTAFPNLFVQGWIGVAPTIDPASRDIRQIESTGAVMPNMNPIQQNLVLKSNIVFEQRFEIYAVRDEAGETLGLIARRIMN